MFCSLPVCWQRSLSNTEDECTHLKEMSERGQEELRELANKYNAAVNEIKELTDKIKVPATHRRIYFPAVILHLLHSAGLLHVFSSRRQRAGRRS